MRRPAEPRLLVVCARSRGASGGRGGILAIRIVQPPLKPPHNVGGERTCRIASHIGEGLRLQREGTRRFEEAEWTLDLPSQIGRMNRGNGKASPEREKRECNLEPSAAHDRPPAPNHRRLQYSISRGEREESS